MDTRTEPDAPRTREIPIERQREISKVVYDMREKLEEAIHPHERNFAINLFIHSCKFYRVDLDGDPAS